MNTMHMYSNLIVSKSVMLYVQNSSTCDTCSSEKIKAEIKQADWLTGQLGEHKRSDNSYCFCVKICNSNSMLPRQETNKQLRSYFSDLLKDKPTYYIHDVISHLTTIKYTVQATHQRCVRDHWWHCRWGHNKAG